MKTRARLLVTIAALGAATLAMPEPAAAQGRAAVRRPARARAEKTVFIGGYYNPFFYNPFIFYAPLYPTWYASFGPWFPPYYGYGRGYYDSSAAMRLHVTPRETEVFVDGYYAGTVDDFDGVFQRLRLEPGDHDVVLYLEGHRPYEQKLYLQPGRTFSIRHMMEPLAPGETAPARPSGGALPPSAAQRSSARLPGEPPPDAQAEFGALALRVQPDDAEVLIDGQRWEGSAEAERLVVQLAPGVHTLEIRKDGYRSYITEVTIRSRETASLNVAMTPQ